MAYDTIRQQSILFGGEDFSQDFGDTWAWDGAEWTLRSTTGPAPRRLFNLAFDEARGVVVLFGGWADDGIPALDDTWIWNGTAWSELPISGPSPRSQYGIAYDKQRDVVLLFGGIERLESGPPTWMCDTWEFDGTEWRFLTDTGPSPRSNPGMGYIHNGVILLHGGRNADNDPLNDTWLWNGSEWDRLPDTDGPSRGVISMAFADRNSTALFFGGQTEFDLFDDTWQFRVGDIAGDLNCDCATDLLDVDPFVLALLDPAQYMQQYPNCDRLLADANGDGLVNTLDIEPFVDLLVNP
jgi:hypothetical protein